MKIYKCWLLYICFCKIILSYGQSPVKPEYALDKATSVFSSPLLSDHATLQEILFRKTAGYHEESCLSNTHQSGNSGNRLVVYPNATEMKEYMPYVTGNTYWMNEFLHIGHLPYDITLIQLFQSCSIDRIVVQRAVCNEKLCNGVGTVESFYRGFFISLLAAANMTHVPVYLRFSWREKEVRPLYFFPLPVDVDNPESTNTSDIISRGTFTPKSDIFLQYQNRTIKNPAQIFLPPLLCFEKLYRRTQSNFGSLPVLSIAAIQRFKAAAYTHLPSTGSPIPTYFTGQPPYRIVFAYRGPTASRHIHNQEYLTALLSKHFPAPLYDLVCFNTSRNDVTYQDQFDLVSSAYVVLTNHGAFETNMIYMKNSSLLIEMFGNYGNNEIHMFHRMAILFGLYYARVHHNELTNHHLSSYNITEADGQEIVDIIQDYFDRKAYRHNLPPETFSSSSTR